MRGIKKTAALTMSVLVLAAGAASAKTVPGSNAGEVLHGSRNADTIHGYGGADLIYAYGGRDTVWGGNEAGKGDKVLGASSSDHLIGQQGRDALYGDGGGDFIEGQYGNDLVVGGGGEDTLSGGPGADKVDARDGQKDTISIRFGEGDVVYYDKGIDVLQAPASSQGAAGKNAALTAAEAADREVELSTQRPPRGLFEPSGEILVEHEGGKLLVPEGALEAHLGHGDKILDPTGRAATAEGGRD